MKKIVLMASLSVLCATSVLAEPPSVSVPQKQKQAVTLKNLDFKTVMMAFYQHKIRHVVIPELDAEKVQYVGSEADDIDTVLIFYPAEKYTNAANEERYVLTVSEMGVDKGRKEIIYCGACAVQTDVYLFSKTAQGQYQLVSQSVGENSWASSGYNISPYEPKAIVRQLELIGPKVKGYIEEDESGLQGYSITTLSIAPFDERSELKMDQIAEIRADDSATGADDTYAFEGQYRFLNSVHDGLYDIEIKYQGTQRADESRKIVPMNETRVYHYNAKQQKYIQVK